MNLCIWTKQKREQRIYIALIVGNHILARLKKLKRLNDGHRFPEAYREFLLWMGRGGRFLRGFDCFYRHLKDLPSFAQELLEEDQFIGQLPENAFIFLMYQGFQFNFFYLDDSDDPPIYWYSEEIPTMTSFTLLYSCFSEFILTEIERHIKLYESLAVTKKIHTKTESNEIGKSQKEEI